MIDNIEITFTELIGVMPRVLAESSKQCYSALVLPRPTQAHLDYLLFAAIFTVPVLVLFRGCVYLYNLNSARSRVESAELASLDETNGVLKFDTQGPYILVKERGLKVRISSTAAALGQTAVYETTQECKIPGSYTVESVESSVIAIVDPSNVPIGTAFRLRHGAKDLLVTAFHVAREAARMDQCYLYSLDGKRIPFDRDWKIFLASADGEDSSEGAEPGFDIVAIDVPTHMWAALGVRGLNLGRKFKANSCSVRVYGWDSEGQHQSRGIAKPSGRRVFEFFHYCSTNVSWSGSPLISNVSGQVIGVHLGTREDRKSNRATCLLPLLRPTSERTQESEVHSAVWAKAGKGFGKKRYVRKGGKRRVVVDVANQGQHYHDGDAVGDDLWRSTGGAWGDYILALDDYNDTQESWSPPRIDTREGNLCSSPREHGSKALSPRDQYFLTTQEGRKAPKKSHEPGLGNESGNPSTKTSANKRKPRHTKHGKDYANEQSTSTSSASCLGSLGCSASPDYIQSAELLASELSAEVAFLNQGNSQTKDQTRDKPKPIKRKGIPGQIDALKQSIVHLRSITQEQLNSNEELSRAFQVTFSRLANLEQTLQRVPVQKTGKGGSKPSKETEATSHGRKHGKGGRKNKTKLGETDTRTKPAKESRERSERR